MLLGYGDRTQPFEHVAPNIHAKALAIEDRQGRRAIVVTADVAGFQAQVITESVCDRIRRETGLERSQLLFNGSPSHTGPLVSLDPWSEANALAHAPLSSDDGRKTRAYTRALQDKLAAQRLRVDCGPDLQSRHETRSDFTALFHRSAASIDSKKAMATVPYSGGTWKGRGGSGHWDTSQGAFLATRCSSASALDLAASFDVRYGRMLSPCYASELDFLSCVRPVEKTKRTPIGCLGLNQNTDDFTISRNNTRKYLPIGKFNCKITPTWNDVTCGNRSMRISPGKWCSLPDLAKLGRRRWECHCRMPGVAT